MVVCLLYHRLALVCEVRCQDSTGYSLFMLLSRCFARPLLHFLLAFVPRCRVQLVGGLGRGKKVYVVCCEPGARAALGKSLKADIRDMSAKNLPPAKAGDVQVVITPVGCSCADCEEKKREKSALGVHGAGTVAKF